MITAIVLAAGESRRMGRPKMTLPWARTTVLGHVIQVVKAAGIPEVVVVTGAARDETERVCREEHVRSAFNDNYAGREMLSSLQTGLKVVGSGTEAALVVLGDQPQIQESTIRAVVGAFSGRISALVVPSFHMRRGHPWLVARMHWDEILGMEDAQTPRDFLRQHDADITYVEVETPTIFQDLDTPDDYLKMQP